MTSMKNLNANIGDKVVVTDGFFVVLPWAAYGGSPLASVSAEGMINGTYVIDAVAAETKEEGSEKSYHLTRFSDEVMVARDFGGTRFYDHKLT